MSRDVRVVEIPPCDICVATDPSDVAPGTYNAPMTGQGQRLFGGSWANLCQSHFDVYGIDSSVTERRIL